MIFFFFFEGSIKIVKLEKDNGFISYFSPFLVSSTDPKNKNFFFFEGNNKKNHQCLPREPPPPPPPLFLGKKAFFGFGISWMSITWIVLCFLASNKETTKANTNN